MSNIAVVGDLHLGMSPNNSLKFESIFESQKNFLKECLIPELRSRSIETVIFTGDLYDQRKRVDSKILQFVEGFFENDMKDFKCIIIQGNHDTYFKDDLEVTSLSNIWSKTNVKVINKITAINLYGVNCLLVPWLTSNMVEGFSDNAFKVSGKYEYVIGHFETVGFPFESGDICTEGLNPEVLYKNFKNTISGHFHTQSYKEFGENNIHYVGTPYQLTFADCGEVKGFHIVNLSNGSREFIENTKSSKFIRVKNKKELNSYDSFTNCFVEFHYNDDVSKEDLFIVEKTLTDKGALYYKFFKSSSASNTETVDRSAEEIKNMEQMSAAIHSESMISMAKVFMEVNHCEDPEMVLEIIEEIKSSISG